MMGIKALYQTVTLFLISLFSVFLLGFLGNGIAQAVDDPGTPLRPNPVNYSGSNAASECAANCAEPCRSITSGFWTCNVPTQNDTNKSTGTSTTSSGVKDNSSIFGSIGSFFNLGVNYQGSASSTFFRLLYRALLPIAFILGMILVAAAGYTLMTSQGDPERTQEGKEQLTSAIMGLLFVLLGAGILRAIISTLIQGTDPGF